MPRDQQAEANALRRQKLLNRLEFASDIGRNMLGLPEAALTLGTGLVSQAGSGLGVTAGMLAQALRGEKPNTNAAVDTLEDMGQRATFAPRTEGGREVLRGAETVGAPLEAGMQWAGQKTANVTGSPAAGAAVYTALNFLDPEHALAAGPAALRTARQASRFLDTNAPKVAGSQGRRGASPAAQQGMWKPFDIADTPGDFSFRSPTVDAFDRMKPKQKQQTQMTGRELRKALTDAGAKKEELTWMGLDKVLDTDEKLNVADVKKLAETNKPEMTFQQARAGESSAKELDEDAVWEKARELAWESDDLQYPQTLMYREPGTRHYVPFEAARDENFESAREMRRWLEDHKESWLDDQFRYRLDNIAESFDEEELADMSDEARETWARTAAEQDWEDTIGDDFELESDTEADPINIDELEEYYVREIRDDPESYGLEGGTQKDAPDYGQYTVGRAGEEPEAAYTVATGRLTGESRFGRGWTQTPEFLQPAKHALEVGEAADTGQMSLLPEGEQSKAYMREALRRKNVMEEPNRAVLTKEATDSHYREFGPSQMYFTRETDRPAPQWGSVQKGVGRVDDPGQLLQTPEGEALPATTQPDRPLRMLEEAQSDWYQKARKGGWAEPSTIAEALKQKVDRAAQLQAFQDSALGEVGTLWRDPNVAAVIERANSPEFADDRRATALREALADWASGQQNPDVQSRIVDSERALVELENFADAGDPAMPLIGQAKAGLDRLRTLQEEDLPDTLGTMRATGPLRETEQYTQLALADALRRAVMEGQQYLAWTPGDVHAQRWATESAQFVPSAENPRIIEARFKDHVTGSTGDTLLNELQAQADNMKDVPQGETFDLDDPDILDKLTAQVRRKMNYGMQDYPDPKAAQRKRAELLRKQMEESSQEYGAGGERVAKHYSPRAFGYEQAYGPMEKHLEALLKRSGLKMPEVRDIHMPGDDVNVPMRGFEIDPDIARAAKRGFTLPY